MTEVKGHWTWANARARYDNIEISEAGLRGMFEENALALKTKNALLRGPLGIFDALQRMQPRTWEVLTTKCSAPMVLRDKEFPEVIDIVVAAGQLPVFFDPFNVGDDLINWESVLACLPEFMHVYFQDFNGMHASLHRLNGLLAYNLPANVRKWHRVSDYRAENKLKKSAIARIAAELGDPENVEIILQTEWSDLMMVNRNANDKILYVAPEGKFQNFFALRDPALKIDALCAHILLDVSNPFLLTA